MDSPKFSRWPKGIHTLTNLWLVYAVPIVACSFGKMRVNINGMDLFAIILGLMLVSLCGLVSTIRVHQS